MIGWKTGTSIQYIFSTILSSTWFTETYEWKILILWNRIQMLIGVLDFETNGMTENDYIEIIPREPIILCQFFFRFYLYGKDHHNITTWLLCIDIIDMKKSKIVEKK